MSEERAPISGSLVTIARLVRSDLTKLSRYWVVIIGYAAIVLISVAGAALVYAGEQALHITSESGYDFAFGMMLRTVDVCAPILYVMICILYAMDVATGTVKYVLTRPVTRMELLLSKYATAMVMVSITVALLWAVALAAGAFAYGLGDMEENGYLLFKAGYVYRQIAIATGLLFVGFAAIASMGLMVSCYSTTTGGAVIVGLILYLLLQSLAIIPATLGIPVEVGGEQQILNWSAFAFPSQLFVPFYLLDDLPTGIRIETWWVWEVQRMTLVCSCFALFFFIVSIIGVRRRDYAL